MPRAAVVLASLAVVGCGGESLDAAETARAWVRAVNTQDWDRACELSVKRSQRECVTALSAGFEGTRGELQIARLRREGDDTLFALDAPETEVFRETKGWTAYAPIEFAVERHDGEHLVHFEVAVIH